MNGAAFQSIKNGDDICVTDPITRIIITCSADLCEQGYESDGDIGTIFDAVADEEDNEHYTEEFIDSLV